MPKPLTVLPAGMVRMWRLGKQSQDMEASMKDHKGPVNSITVKMTRCGTAPLWSPRALTMSP